jgi:hypothetical protein
MNTKEFIVADNDLWEMYVLPEFKQLRGFYDNGEIVLYSIHSSAFLHLILDKPLQKYSLEYKKIADEVGLTNNERSEETDIVDSLVLAKKTGLPLITVNDQIIRSRSRLSRMGIVLLTPEEAMGVVGVRHLHPVLSRYNLD